MNFVPERLQPYKPPLAIGVVWAIILVLANVVLPNWLGPLLLPFSIIGTAVITVLVQLTLPENLRDYLRYSTSRFKKKWRRKPLDVEVTIAANFSLDESAGIDELRVRIQEDLETAPATMDRFESSEETDLGTIHKQVNLDWSPVTPGPSAGLQQENQQVTNLRIEVRGETTYQRLHDMLLTTYDRHNDIKTIFSSYGIDSEGYTVTCELSKPIILENFMAKFDLTSLQAQTTEGVDIEFRDESIRVRNMGESELYAVFETVEDMVTYYG